MARDKGVLAAIDKSPSLKVRSPLNVWMRENHDGFAARLSERMADWSVLAKLFGDAGLTDRYGNPPKPETARKTWQRVRAEVKASRTHRPNPASSRTQTPTVQPANLAAPTDNSDLLRVMSEMSGQSSKMPDPIR
jgi:hypothetical protein